MQFCRLASTLPSMTSLSHEFISPDSVISRPTISLRRSASLRRAQRHQRPRRQRASERPGAGRVRRAAALPVRRASDRPGVPGAGRDAARPSGARSRSVRARSVRNCCGRASSECPDRQVRRTFCGPLSRIFSGRTWRRFPSNCGQIAGRARGGTGWLAVFPIVAETRSDQETVSRGSATRIRAMRCTMKAVAITAATKIDERDREQPGDHDAGNENAPGDASTHRPGGGRLKPSQRDHLEIFATEKISVDAEKHKKIYARRQYVDRQGQQIEQQCQSPSGARSSRQSRRPRNGAPGRFQDSAAPRPPPQFDRGKTPLRSSRRPETPASSRPVPPGRPSISTSQLSGPHSNSAVRASNIATAVHTSRKLASASARPSAVNRRTAGADKSANARNRAETIAAGFYREARPRPIPEIGPAHVQTRRHRSGTGRDRQTASGSVSGLSVTESTVIPGPPEGRSPKSMNTSFSKAFEDCVLEFRARGLCPRPGMTMLPLKLIKFKVC